MHEWVALTELEITGYAWFHVFAIFQWRPFDIGAHPPFGNSEWATLEEK